MLRASSLWRIGPHWHKHDRYGRIVGTILRDGHDVNLDQVRAGLAWHYKHYERGQPPAERATYANAQIVAHAAHLGLWSADGPAGRDGKRLASCW